MFTDVMPGSGRKLAEKAAERENAIVHNGRLDPGVELLSKPYDRTLAAKLRRILDGASRLSDDAQKM